MSKTVIQTQHAPKAIGTYSQGIIFHNLVFASGQIPINPENGKLVENDFKLEVHQVLKNLNAVLSKGGSSLQSAIKITVFLTDLSLFPQLNEVFNNYFPKDPPARSSVQVSALPMNVRIEIEAIGFIK